MHLIEVIEDALGKKAEKNMLPIQPGDVPAGVLLDDVAEPSRITRLVLRGVTVGESGDASGRQCV